MKKILLFLTIVNVIGFTSCKKDEVLTKTELLCRDSWILSASVINPAYFFEEIGAITDYYAILPACAKDDLWIFKENGNFTLENGATKCDPSYPTFLAYGTWAFNSDETVIITDWGSYMVEYDVLELSKEILKIESIIYDSLNNYTWTETYTHQ